MILLLPLVQLWRGRNKINLGALSPRESFVPSLLLIVLINHCVLSEPIVERGLKAIELICELKQFVPRLIEIAPVPANTGTALKCISNSLNSSAIIAWRTYSLPLLVSLGHQSSSASRDVRHSAMSQLQRILLGRYIAAGDHDHAQVDETFNRVVFPLLDELLKPDVFQRDPQGMPETRLRASALLCKVFLHFEMHLSQSKSDIRVLWIQILDLLDRLMNIDKRDQLVSPPVYTTGWCS